MVLQRRLSINSPTTVFAQKGTNRDYEGPAQITRDAASLLKLVEGLTCPIVLAGSPGSGKTVTLLMMARQQVADAKLRREACVPLIISAQSFNKRYSTLEDWLVFEAGRRYGLPPQILRQWLDDDDVVIFLDDLDCLSEESQGALVRLIEKSQHHPGPWIVIASTIGKHLKEMLDREKAAEIRIAALSDEQIAEFLSQYGAAGSRVSALVHTDDQLLRAASSPFWLTLMAAHAVRNEFCTNECLQPDTLIDEYISLSMRQIESAKIFDQCDVRQWVHWLASHMKESRTLELDVSRLQPIEEPDRNHVGLASGLPALLFGVSFGILSLLQHEGAMRAGISAFTGVIIAYFLLFKKKQARDWIERHKSDFIVPVEGIAFAPRILLIAFVSLCAIFAILASQIFGDIDDKSLLWIQLSALSVSSLLGLTIKPIVYPISPAPNAAIRRSGVRGGAVLAILLTAELIYVYAYTSGRYDQISGESLTLSAVAQDKMVLKIGLGFAIWLAFHFGMTAYLRHWDLRIELMQMNRAPFRYIKFLNLAADSGLLYRSGGRYVFPHTLIQARLAEKSFAARAPVEPKP